eukprot:8475264-Lingulodinium_polyedra.AAC.1
MAMQRPFCCEGLAARETVPWARVLAPAFLRLVGGEGASSRGARRRGRRLPPWPLVGLRGAAALGGR